MRLLLSDFLAKAKTTPVLDVRSPAEFAQGHIPGAINFPLFSNEERVIIGTLYKQKGKEIAVLRGLEMVGPKMAPMAKEAMQIAGGEKKILVHCWRGGMRSGSVAILLETLGLEVHTLVKGYKAFRTAVLESFEKEYPLIVLGGKTGSGKTPTLKKLKDRGNQVIDLEGMAHHKGSSFGWLNEKPQPTSEQFENLLFTELQKMDLQKPIWIEDESQNIGKTFLPVKLFAQIRNSQVIQIDVSLKERVEQLVNDYASADREQIRESVLRISKKLGGDRVREAIEALDNGDYAKGAEIALYYYDKAYLNGLSRREPGTIHVLESNGESLDARAERLEKMLKGIVLS